MTRTFSYCNPLALNNISNPLNIHPMLMRFPVWTIAFQTIGTPQSEYDAISQTPKVWIPVY